MTCDAMINLSMIHRIIHWYELNEDKGKKIKRFHIYHQNKDSFAHDRCTIANTIIASKKSNYM